MHVHKLLPIIPQADLAKAQPISATPQTPVMSQTSSTTASGPPPPPSSSSAVKPAASGKAPVVPAPFQSQGKKPGGSKDEEVMRKVEELRKRKELVQQKQKEQPTKVRLSNLSFIKMNAVNTCIDPGNEVGSLDVVENDSTHHLFNYLF